MAIDSKEKRTAVMGMGVPAGAILPYSGGSFGVIERLALLSVGFSTGLADLVSGGLDIEYMFEITRLITSSFNINKIITSSFNIDRTTTSLFDVDKTITSSFDIDKTITSTFELT